MPTHPSIHPSIWLGFNETEEELTMASPPPGPARRSSTCPCRGRARTQGSKGASNLQHAHTHMRGDGDGGLGKDGGRMGAEGGGGRSCVPCAGIQVVQALGDAPASRATAAASSGVGVVHREKGVDPGASGLHRAAGCGSGAVVAGTGAPHPPLHPSIHHPWVGGWKARVSMGGWTSSADEGGRPAAGERRSAVGMGRRGRRRGEQAAAGLERRSLRASFGLVGWGLGFQFFILVYFLI